MIINFGIPHILDKSIAWSSNKLQQRFDNMMGYQYRSPSGSNGPIINLFVSHKSYLEDFCQKNKNSFIFVSFMTDDALGLRISRSSSASCMMVTVHYR